MLTLLLLLVPVTAYADTAYIVTGTRNYLALRSEPKTAESNEIGMLHNGELFYVTSNGKDGFAYGYDAKGKYGYVNARYLQLANGQQAANTQPPQGVQPQQPGYQPAPQGYQPQQKRPEPQGYKPQEEGNRPPQGYQPGPGELAPGYQQAQNYLPAQNYQQAQNNLPAQQAGTPKTVTGTKNYLAVRSSPTRSEINETGRLHNGDIFYVIEYQNSGYAYGYTASGHYGYVVSEYLR